MLDGRGTLRELLCFDFSFGPFFTYDLHFIHSIYNDN